VPTFGEGGLLNVVAGLMAVALGVLVVAATRRYERRHTEEQMEVTV